MKTLRSQRAKKQRDTKQNWRSRKRIALLKKYPPNPNPCLFRVLNKNQELSQPQHMFICCRALWRPCLEPGLRYGKPVLPWRVLQEPLSTLHTLYLPCNVEPHSAMMCLASTLLSSVFTDGVECGLKKQRVPKKKRTNFLKFATSCRAVRSYFHCRAIKL